MASHTSKATWDKWAINAKNGKTVSSSQSAKYDIAVAKNAEIVSAKLKITITSSPKAGSTMRVMSSNGTAVSTSIGSSTVDVTKYVKNTDAKQSAFDLKIYFSYSNSASRAFSPTTPIGSVIPVNDSTGASSSSSSSSTVGFTAELTVEWKDAEGSVTFGPPTDYSVEKWCVENETTMYWSGATGTSSKPIKGYRIWYKDYNMETHSYESGIKNWKEYGDPIETSKGFGSCTVTPPKTRGQKRRYAVQTLSDTEHPDKLTKASQLLTSFEYGTVFKNQAPTAPDTSNNRVNAYLQVMPKDYISGPVTLTWHRFNDPDNDIASKPQCGTRGPVACVMYYELQCSETGTDPWRDVCKTTSPHFISATYKREAESGGIYFPPGMMPTYWRVRAIDDEGAASPWTDNQYGQGVLQKHQNPKPPIMKGFPNSVSNTNPYVLSTIWESGELLLAYDTNGNPSSTKYEARTKIQKWVVEEDQRTLVDVTDWEIIPLGVSQIRYENDPQTHASRTIYVSRIMPTVSTRGQQQVYQVCAIDDKNFRSEYTSDSAIVIKNQAPYFTNEGTDLNLQLTYKEDDSFVAKRNENPSEYSATLNWRAASDPENTDLSYEIFTRSYRHGVWGSWSLSATVNKTEKTWTNKDNPPGIIMPSVSGEIQQWRVRAVDAHGARSDYTNTVELMTRGLPLTPEEEEAMQNFLLTGLYVDEAGYVAHALTNSKPDGWEDPQPAATVRIMTDVQGEQIKQTIDQLKEGTSGPINQAVQAVKAILDIKRATWENDIINQAKAKIDAYIYKKLKGGSADEP